MSLRTEVVKRLRWCCNVHMSGKLFATIILVLVTNAVSAQTVVPPDDVKGWQDTQWGARLPEIVDKYGPLTKHAPFRRKPGEMHFKKPNWDILGDNFEVWFLFDRKGGLTDVTLYSSLTRSSISDISREKLASKILSSLKMKYGTPEIIKNIKKDSREEYGLLGGILEKEFIYRWTFISSIIDFDYSYSLITIANSKTFKKAGVSVERISVHYLPNPAGKL